MSKRKTVIFLAVTGNSKRVGIHVGKCQLLPPELGSPAVGTRLGLAGARSWLCCWGLGKGSKLLRFRHGTFCNVFTFLIVGIYSI